MAGRDDLFDLKDKVAIVTGAGSGLGEAIAVGYAEYGAAVAVVDLDEASAKRVAQIIVDRGGQAVPLTCNVSNPLDVQAVVASLISEFNRIDILVNNAGIGRRSEAEEMSDDTWRTVLDVNLNGAFFFCRDVGREMIKRGVGGRIINMASIGGVVGVETGNANYCASKGGLIAMTRCLAIEWAKHGILVNAIAPTHMRTPLIEKLLKEKPEVETYFLNNIPLGRLGDPGDILGPAVFLASEAASFVTGHVLLVDGGHTAK
jgi:NAD(P)-dependent dehydrogenase (short-subunit alcohol dehydrogenase family)